MVNPKQLGAKQMFDQSLVYLYNSYREDGLSAVDARQRVVKEIEEAFNKYKINNVTPIKDFGISDPIRIIDNALEEIKEFEGEVVVKTKNIQQKTAMKSFTQSMHRKLFHLKKVLGG